MKGLVVKNTDDDTIDSPGEYAESKHFSVGLACFSFEADVVAMVPKTRCISLTRSLSSVDKISLTLFCFLVGLR